MLMNSKKAIIIIIIIITTTILYRVVDKVGGGGYTQYYPAKRARPVARSCLPSCIKIIYYNNDHTCV